MILLRVRNDWAGPYFVDKDEKRVNAVPTVSIAGKLYKTVNRDSKYTSSDYGSLTTYPWTDTVIELRRIGKTKPRVSLFEIAKKCDIYLVNKDDCK